MPSNRESISPQQTEPSEHEVSVPASASAEPAVPGSPGADHDGRRYPRLSEEQKDRVLTYVQTWIQAGFCSPTLEDSLLGLDWSLFGVGKVPGLDGDEILRTPPEFVIYGFSALDAYATAMLAAHFPHPVRGTWHYTCSLRQVGAAAGMQMEFVAEREEGTVDARTVMVELLDSFSQLLRARGIQADEVYFLDGVGCRMRVAYPGKMVAELSPYLRNRPADLWPSVTLSVAVTEELVTRAGTTRAFVRDLEPAYRFLN